MIIQLVNYLGGISMNKIFKIVWSEAVGAFVVASELAKGHTKSTTVKKTATGLKILFRLTALAVAVWGSAGTAWAVVAPTGQVATGSGGETAVNGADARGTGAVAIGTFARAGTRSEPPHGMNSGTVAIGGSNASTAALADGNNAIAIGTSANSNAAKATSIGSDAIASDQFATALGGRAEAKARGATAIGGWTQATGQFAVAIGGSDRFGRDNNTELNDGSGATLASGDRSTAIGRRAKASGNDTLAFGTNAEATGVDAVALGTNANASILKSIAIGKNTQATGEASIVIGSDDHIYGEIKASSRQGIAIGTGAKATGATQAVAIGPDAIASGTQSTSIGNNTRATGDSSIAIGGDDWNTVRTKQVEAAGNKQVHEVFQELTGMKMRADSGSTFKGTTSADAAVAVGVKAYAKGVLSTAFGSGTSATGLGASAFGVGAEASKDKSVAIGAGSNTSTNATAITTATVNDVTYSSFSGTAHITEGSQVSVGRVGYERQIKHVAPGEISATSTDAINGSQLYHVASQAANPLKFDGDSGTTVERKLGSTLNVKGGATGTLTDNNIGVVADKSSNTLRLKLAQNVNLGDAGSLRTGDTIVNNDGVAITGGPSITKTGISAGNKPITNVASGGTTDSNAANIGDVKKAAAAAKTEVQGGTNVASVTKTDNPTDGHAVYTVNAKGAAVALENGADGLKLTSSEDTTTNVTTYKLDLADKTKTSLTKADSALQNIGVQVNGNAAKTLNQANSTLNFVNGTGTTAENKNGDIAFNVNKANLSVNGGTVSADKQGDEFATAKSVADAINQAVTNSEKTSVVAAGDNTHVASTVSGNQTTYTVHADKTTVSAKTDGKLTVTSAETANGNQTKTTNYELDLTDAAKAEIAKGVDAKTAVDTKGIGFAADSGSPVTKKLGDSLNIKGDNKNITTKTNNGDVHVTLNDDISVHNVNAAASVITPKVVAGDSTLTSDGLNITSGPSVTKTGISAGNKPITNVASGGTTDSNAANIGDVKKAAAAAKTVVKQGANTSVSSATDAATGATEYTVNAEKSVVQGSSDVTVNAVTNGLTTTYTADLSTTAKASLAKADTAVQKVVSSNPNLTASKTGDTVTLDFSQTPSFTSVTTGNSVLTTDGLKITNGTNSVSLTNTGLSNGGKKITNIADGAADTDAASYKQVKAAKTEVQAGTNVASVIKTDGTNGQAIYTVNAKAAAVTLENGADGLKLTSAEDTASNLTTYKLDLADKTKTSLAKADSALQNIGVQVNGTAAKTLNQANSTLNFVNGTGTTAENKNGDIAFNVNKANLSVNGGTVSADKQGDEFATAKSVADAINQAVTNSEKTSVVAAGDNTHVASTVSGNQTTYTVHADKTTVSAKTDGKLTVTSAETANGNQTKTTNYELDLTDAAKAEIAKGVEAKTAVDTKGITFSGNSGSPVTKKLDETLAIKGDNKNVVTEAGTDGITVKLKDDVTLTSVTAETLKAGDSELTAAGLTTPKVTAGDSVLTTGGLKIGADGSSNQVSLTNAGLNNGGNKITKVAEGTLAAESTDAVNGAQLYKVDQKADTNAGNIAKGINIGGTSGSNKYALGDTVNIKGDSNIVSETVEGGVQLKLADTVKIGQDSGKPVSIDGVNGMVSGLSNTTLGGADFATKGQAASEEQLNATQANLANLLGGNAANDKGNVTTTDIGGTGKDNVHDAIAAVKETADKGWNLNANDETSSEKIGAGDTVTFKEGKNVKVSRNGKNITVATSDDVSFDKVTVGGSILTDNGLTVGNGKAGKPVSLTKDGLNNGGNKVSDIAAGEADTDAVNVAQLKAAAAKATSKVDSGNDNIVVTPEQNADGSTTYKVATAPNLKADSFTAGDTVVNKDGVKVGDKVALGKDGLKAGDVNITADGINAGNKAISNVAAGVKDTDAANVGQLNRLTAAAKTEVEAGTNIASVTSKQGANGQTVYTVNADGASVSAGSDNIVVTKGNKDANNVTDYAVDLSKAVKADIAKGVAAKDAVDNKGISFAGDSGTTVANKLGDTVAVKGDANIITTAGANGIQVGLNKDLKVDSVKAGDTVVNNNGVNVGDKVALSKDGLKAGDVNITAEGINAGGKKVTGVAAGTVAAGSTDAVNGGQLHQVYELIGSNGGNVNTAPPAVEADGKAGLGNIKNITLVDNSNNLNVTNVTNETKIAQSNGYSLVTYNVEDQGMYVTNNVIEAVGRMNEQGIKFFHTNDGKVNPDVQAHNSEDSSASGAYATAVGYQAASKGINAIAIGKGAKANAENTIAIGTGNIVSGKNSGAIGDPTVVSGNSSYSIGNNNNVSADNAYALGSDIKATVKDSVYLGDRAQTQGIRTADAAKGEAYTYGGLNDKAVAGKAGSTAAANKVAGVVTVGNGTDETRQVQGVAAGVVSADSTDAINGSQLYYTNQAIANVVTQATAAKTEVTAGKNVVVNQTTGNSGQTVYNVATADKLDVTSVTAGGVTVNAQGVSIAAPTANNPANTVSLSPTGLNNGGQRITNVAPAKEGTDAVNLNQLAGMGNALQNNIERVGKRAYAGVAGAIAHSSIPQVTRPGATGLSVGSGYYGGQSAVAVGLSTMSDNGNWVFKGSFSANTDGHLGVGAGALYQW